MDKFFISLGIIFMFIAGIADFITPLPFDVEVDAMLTVIAFVLIAIYFKIKPQ